MPLHSNADPGKQVCVIPVNGGYAQKIQNYQFLKQQGGKLQHHIHQMNSIQPNIQIQTSQTLQHPCPCLLANGEGVDCEHKAHLCYFCLREPISILEQQQQSYALPLTVQVLLRQFCVRKFSSATRLMQLCESGQLYDTGPLPISQALLPVNQALVPVNQALLPEESTNALVLKSDTEGQFIVPEKTLVIFHASKIGFRNKGRVFLRYVQAGKQFEIGVIRPYPEVAEEKFSFTYGGQPMNSTISQAVLNFKSANNAKFTPHSSTMFALTYKSQAKVPNGCEVRCFHCGFPSGTYYCNRCEREIPTSQPLKAIDSTPEAVINEILQMINGTDPDTQFVRIPCEYICVGSYKVISEDMKQNKELSVAFTSKGIFFVINDVTGVQKKCVLVMQEIVKIEAYLQAPTSVFFITIGAKNACWLRANLGFEGKEEKFSFSPENPDSSEKYVILKMSSVDIKPVHKSIVKRLFAKVLQEVVETTANHKLIECTRKGTATPRSQSSQPSPTLASPTVDVNYRLLKRYGYEIYVKDIVTLSGEEYINDTIVDFWLAHIYANLDQIDRERTHIFSTFFYKRLTRAGKRRIATDGEKGITIHEKRHQRVKNWTKNIDLFSKDFVIIPIVEDSHWYLAIICFPGLDGIHSLDDSSKLPYHNIEKNVPHLKRKCVCTVPIKDSQGEKSSDAIISSVDHSPRIKQPIILLFDSLRTTSNHIKVFDILRKYLETEYKRQKNSVRNFDKLSLPGFQPTVPQQPNYCDCGIYLLNYVESFFKNPVRTYWLPFVDLANWFSSSIVYTKRKEIYQTMVEIAKSESSTICDKIPTIKFSPSPAISEVIKESPETEKETEAELMDIPIDVEGD